THRATHHLGARAACEAHRRLAERPYAPGEPVSLQTEPVAAERVREDEPSPRVHEVSVDGFHPKGLHDVELLEAGADRRTALDQGRPHSSVGEPRSPGEQPPESTRAHAAMPP